MNLAYANRPYNILTTWHAPKHWRQLPLINTYRGFKVIAGGTPGGTLGFHWFPTSSYLPCWSLPGRAHPVDRLRSFQGSLLGGISIHWKGVGNEEMIGRNWGRNCGIDVDCTTAQNKMWQMCRERSGGLCFQSTHRMLGQGIYKICTLVRHVFLEIPRSSSFAIELSPQSIYLSKMDTLSLPSCPTGW